MVGFHLRLWLTVEDEELLARAEIPVATDVVGESMVRAPAIIDGFVSIQEVSPTGRNRGRFELVFARGSIAGTYDAVIPP